MLSEKSEPSIREPGPSAGRLMDPRWLITTLALGLVVVAPGCEEGGRSGAAPGVSVAVAGNFAAPQRELARKFRETTGVVVETSVGATGQLYAQIANGAPFDVFLSADTARPRQLEDDGLAVPGTRFTYAVGRIALYAPRWGPIPAPGSDLRDRKFEHMVIANPDLAPYGVAARTALSRWELWDDLQPRIVRAENIAQVYQFVESGAADVGIVALSDVVTSGEGMYRIVPDSLHEPIRQDAALLRHGEQNPAAREFLEFLRSEEARRMILGFGYELR